MNNMHHMKSKLIISLCIIGLCAGLCTCIDLDTVDPLDTDNPTQTFNDVEAYYRQAALIKDAVLASCSAPTYFDPHIVNPYLLADGGLWANNPGLIAIIDAKKRLGIKFDNIRILSLGTGHSKKAYGNKKKRNWGFLNGWKNRNFIGFILSLQSQSMQNCLNLLLEPNQILRINFETDLPVQLDDITELNNLISQADRDFTYNCTELKMFLT